MIFSLSSTGSLIGMILSIVLFQRGVAVRVGDLVGLLVANFFIIGLSNVLYGDEKNSKLENTIKIGIHYIATVLILYGIGRKLQWVRLDLNENIVPYIAIITMIYIGVCVISYSGNYQTSKKINKALSEYQNKRKAP